MKVVLQGLSVFVVVIMMVGCVDPSHYAPVETAKYEILKPPTKYSVSSGETLYSITWKYGLDYGVVAKNNNIAPPYNIKVGQVLWLTDKSPKSVKPAVEKKKQLKANDVVKPMVREKAVAAKTTTVKLGKVTRWYWPAQGRRTGRYSYLNPGVNILGKRGDPVKATAAGVVVYAGGGIQGYGNLIIIKHNDEYLSAYAHNDKLLVAMNDQVKAGQEIAKMGDSGITRVMLHFEIRRHGKPIDPMRLLK